MANTVNAGYPEKYSTGFEPGLIDRKLQSPAELAKRRH
jgi:hypothetical protein